MFSRWCQVMLRFEKSMYENPDQDLNELWWDLEEKYQGIKRPEGRNEPDYASKIHIVTSRVLLPQLHDGRFVRIAGASCDRAGCVSRGRTANGHVCGE